MIPKNYCDCGVFDSFLSSLGEGVKLDSDNRCYILPAGNRLYSMRYCPFCGRKLFDNSDCLYSSFDADELAEAKQKGLSIRSIKEAIETLGKPDQMLVNPIPGHTKFAAFKNGWTSLELCVSELDDGSFQLSIRPVLL